MDLRYRNSKNQLLSAKDCTKEVWLWLKNLQLSSCKCDFVNEKKKKKEGFVLFCVFAYQQYYHLYYRVSEVDLDEEEILKLSSLGSGADNKDTIDILRKSLVLRNRSVISNHLWNLK